MFEDRAWIRRILGAATVANLAVALAVVGGAIPVQGQSSAMRSASAAPLDATVPAPEGAEGSVLGVAADVTAAASMDASPAPDPGAASPSGEGLPHAPAPAPTVEAPAAPPPAPSQPPAPAAAPAPVAPAAPQESPPVPRRQPSSAEVQQALDGLDPFVDSVFTPSAAQVSEAGDKVCAALDEGQTFAQVKATARELVAKVPLTTVHAGADDYVVRTVVALYCPGHGSKLV